MKCCTSGQRESSESSKVSTTAPSSGPYTELPPNSTTSKKKMDRLKVMKSELMYWFCCAIKAPAMPQVKALITKASTLNLYTLTPTLSAATSAVLTARNARPKRPLSR